MPAKFAMVIAPASIPAAAHRDDDGAAEIAARVASGPGFWTEWLAEPGREGPLEELLADGVIARALREAPPGHKYDRVLTAKMTVACVLVACLFPGAGYDAVLATAFGLPGLRSGPGTEIPSGSAFSQARKLLGEQVMHRLFELDAAVADADLGIGLRWKGLEVTAIDGTTMELARNDVLDGEFGTPADGARPLLRVTAHVRTTTFRWIGAAIGGYHDGENALADQLEGSFRPGLLNLADRGFFSMDRFLRFSGTEGFEFSKGCFGLDQSQVRLYHAIARHTVLVMAAFAVCAVTAALLRDRTDTQASCPASPGQSPPVDPGLIPLTVPEIRRLLALRPAHRPDHAEHWSLFRRRHQARAR